MNTDPTVLRADLDSLMDLVQDIRTRLEKLEASQPKSKDHAIVEMMDQITSLTRSAPTVKWTRAMLGHNLVGTTRGTEYGRVRIACDRLVDREVLSIVGGTESEPLFQWYDVDELDA